MTGPRRRHDPRREPEEKPRTISQRIAAAGRPTVPALESVAEIELAAELRPRRTVQLEPVVLERAARLVAWGIERGAKGPHTTEDQRRLAQFLALTDTVRACLQTALQAVEKGDAHAAQRENRHRPRLQQGAVGGRRGRDADRGAVPAGEAMTPMTHGELVRFVRNHLWVTARSAPDNPHQYTLRENADPAEFAAAFLFIRKHGYHLRFGREIYTCYNIGPHRYWTMPLDTVEGAMLINRASNLDVVFCIEKQTVLPFGDRG